MNFQVKQNAKGKFDVVYPRSGDVAATFDTEAAAYTYVDAQYKNDKADHTDF